MMNHWRDLLVQPDWAIRAVLEKMDAGAVQFAIVVDGDGRLVGTVSDGDVRRALLAMHGLNEPISVAMNTRPTTVREDADTSSVVELLHALHLRHMPIVDAQGHVVGLHLLSSLLKPRQQPNIVVLMAGGLGERLRPFTERVPKPMLEVGGRPILETILLQFLWQGFHRFHISLNYRGEVIEDHFGDGSRWGAQIQYLREPMRLGTAGSLGLLPQRPTEPIVVMNGDILTKVDVRNVVAFHESVQAEATMCVRDHEYQVPFGVVRTNGSEILEFEEKPMVRWSVNAGIYVLAPSCLDEIPPSKYFDMPSLFDAVRARGGRTRAYSVKDYWLDVGRPADLERAHVDFAPRSGGEG